MDIELKHTWRVPRSAWYIRFYVWLWEAQERDITFCKLFWGYVLAWAGLPLRALVGIRRGIREVGRQLDQGVVIQDYKPPKPSKPKRARCRPCKKGRPHTYHWYWACSGESECTKYRNRGNDHSAACHISRKRYQLVYDDALLVDSVPPSWMMRRLTKFADRMSQLNMWLKKPRPRLARVGGWMVALLAVAGGIGAIVGLVLAIVAHPHDALVIAEWGGAGITAIAMVSGVVYAAIVSGLVLAFHKVVLRGFGRNSKKAGLGFGRMMKIGYVSVKSNTCPRVEIEQ